MPSKFKARTVVFTCFKEEAVANPQEWLQLISNECDWVLAQLEKCPKTQRTHIQGMAYSKENSCWKMLVGEHTWKQKCQSPMDSIDYVTKGESRIDGPWEYGTRPTWNIKGKKLSNKELLSRPLTQLVDEELVPIKGLKKLKEDIDTYNIMKQAAIDRTKIVEDNIWLFGKPGVGKSYWVRETYGDSLYIKSQNKWWDGYVDQQYVLIDDFDRGGQHLSHYLKIWGDQYNLKGEVKGSTINLMYKRLIITSNYKPEEIWPDDMILVQAIERRFKMYHMTDWYTQTPYNPQ